MQERGCPRAYAPETQRGIDLKQVGCTFYYYLGRFHAGFPCLFQVDDEWDPFQAINFGSFCSLRSTSSVLLHDVLPPEISGADLLGMQLVGNG